MHSEYDAAVELSVDLVDRCRARLFMGYRPNRCLESVYTGSGSHQAQCPERAIYRKWFDGIVGFCDAHWPDVVAVLEAPQLIQARLADEARERRRRIPRAGDFGVYVFGEPNGDRVKIGITGNKYLRMKHLRGATGIYLQELLWLPAATHTEAKCREAILHNLLDDSRIAFEWFSTGGDTQAFLDRVRSVA